MGNEDHPGVALSREGEKDGQQQCGIAGRRRLRQAEASNGERPTDGVEGAVIQVGSAKARIAPIATAPN